MNLFDETSNITKQLLDGVMKQLTVTDEDAFVSDDVTKVVRTRITAEICSTLVKLHSLKISDNHLLQSVHYHCWKFLNHFQNLTLMKKYFIMLQSLFWIKKLILVHIKNQNLSMQIF